MFVSRVVRQNTDDDEQHSSAQELKKKWLDYQAGAARHGAERVGQRASSNHADAGVRYGSCRQQ